MTRDEILVLMKRLNDSWNAHDVAALGALHSPNCVVVSPTGGVLEGRAEIERVYRLWFTAFPDSRYRSDEILIDGDRVVEVAQFSGTHAGEFFGVPATRRRIDVQIAVLLTVAGGLVVEERRIYDFTGFLVQVGVLKAKPVA
jgi:predicted ester cyclase